MRDREREGVVEEEWVGVWVRERVGGRGQGVSVAGCNSGRKPQLIRGTHTYTLHGRYSGCPSLPYTSLILIHSSSY